MDCTLMHKNIPVVDMEILSDTGRIVRLFNLQDPEHLPLGVKTKNGMIVWRLCVIIKPVEYRLEKSDYVFGVRTSGYFKDVICGIQPYARRVFGCVDD